MNADDATRADPDDADYAPTPPDDRSEGDDDRDAGPLGLSRRALLAGAGTAGLAAALGIGWSLRGEPPTDTPTPTITPTPPGDGGPTPRSGHLPFDVWREMRAAFRESPDHRPARAEALVAAGDPEAIFEFVRDDVLTIPGSRTGVGSPSRSQRWGPRATLRGGMGTPHEKADLLVESLVAAGFGADLVYGPATDRAGLASLYFGQTTPEFDPSIDAERATAWRDRLGIAAETGGSYRVLDPDGTESAALAADVLGALGPEGDRREPAGFDWRGGPVPVVRFWPLADPAADGGEIDPNAATDDAVSVDTGDATEPGESDPRTAFEPPDDPDSIQYANLFAPGVPFGEAGTERPPTKTVAEPTETLPVSVSLAAATADAPNDPFELVSGEWRAEDLVGRQLLVQTLPGVDPFDYPSVRFSDVGTFLPALTVQGADLDREAAAALSVVGDAVARNGDRVGVDESGAVERNGRPLVEADAGADPAAVADLAVAADAGRYPNLRLRVRATDAAGDPVDGLAGSAFEVTDEGEPVAVTLSANRAAPRVKVLYDTSASMPIAYYGDGMDAFVEGLTETIREANPAATVDPVPTSSDLWTALADAADTDANLIVYATDGDVADEATPERVAAIEQGPPAVMVCANGSYLDVAGEMADASGGTVVLAEERDATTDAIAEYVADVGSELASYLLDYGCPGEGTGTRTAAVRVPEADVEATTTYEVPETALLGSALSGLYLTVAVGRHESTRTLAGWNPATEDRRGTAPTRAHVEDVAGALFGANTLSFEAGAPSTATWFDDLLDAKCSVADLDLALSGGDAKAVEAATDAGFRHLPPALALLQAPIPDRATADSLTYPDGLRVAMYRERPVFGADHVLHQTDVFPFAGFRTITDADERWREFDLTAERTARIAVVERDRYDESTASLLAGESLADRRSAEGDWEYDARDSFDRVVERGGLGGYGGRNYQVVPADGTPVAFWNVDHETGALLGVLADGSGGGTGHPGVDRLLREYDRVVSILNLYVMGAQAAGAINPIGGFALGVVAAYGQTLARLYAGAGLAVLAMDADEADEAVTEATGTLLCNVAKSVVYAGFTKLELVPWLENILGSMGAPNPLSC
ncbi:MAG: hypothetical protein ABEJ26_07770 [Halosimplex sp.]